MHDALFPPLVIACGAVVSAIAFRYHDEARPLAGFGAGLIIWGLVSLYGLEGTWQGALILAPAVILMLVSVYAMDRQRRRSAARRREN